jgi:hypothetical protein
MISCEFKREVNSRLSADKRLIVSSSGADEGGRRLISKAQSIQDTFSNSINWGKFDWPNKPLTRLHFYLVYSLFKQDPSGLSGLHCH